MDLTEQCARRRLAAYQPRFADLTAPFQAVAVLTTDLDGEAFEIAFARDDTSTLTLRGCPGNPISPDSRAVHGVALEDLVNMPALAVHRFGLDVLLRDRPTLMFNAPFVQRALDHAMTRAGRPPLPWDTYTIVDVQAQVRAADLDLDPDYRYRPSLQGLEWTVPIGTVDRTRALGSAQVLLQAVQFIRAGTAITSNPLLRRAH